MMEPRLVCRPLVTWPGRLLADSKRARSPFTAAWSSTVDLLTREARLLDARDVVVQLAVSEQDLRLDGWIRANARPTHPGVTVVVAGPRVPGERLSFSTDRYGSWQANVRAVALSMEALRAADRHGIMKGRQYAGFRELTAGSTAMHTTREDAARFIAEIANHPNNPPVSHAVVKGVLDDREVLARTLKFALAKTHPDRNGGERERWDAVQAAAAVLEGRAP